MGDIKPVSFRINEEDQDKFKVFASENGMNQAEAFASLLNTLEMAQAKSQIGDRAKEIETFQDTVNRLTSMFINSLAINQTSEERIRESLSLELRTKDQTIADLQGERNKLRETLKVFEENNKDLTAANKTLETEITKLNDELKLKIESDKNQQEQIATLNSIVTEYKGYKESNIKLEQENKELNALVADGSNKVIKLEGEIKNSADMITFYKEQLDSCKTDIKNLNKSLADKDQNHKSDLEKLEEKFKKELAELKENHKNELQNKTVEYQEKLSFELQKKDIEIAKSKSENNGTPSTTRRQNANKKA